MISSAPRLTFSHLPKWTFASKKPINLPDGFKGLHWRSSGALCLAEICLEISRNNKRKINVYIPGYFCGQSLGYLRTLPVHLHFYALNEMLLPDYSILLDADNPPEIDVFVHVHYFGCIAGQAESRDFCNSLNAILIEDCAHIMSPALSSTWVGDYLIFSPHKHFPLPKVALLITRKVYFSTMEHVVEKFPLTWILKELVKKFIIFKKNVIWKRTWTKNEQSINLSQSNNRVKIAALNHLDDYLSDSAKRMENMINLMKEVSRIPHWRSLQRMDTIDCPYLLGMICQSPEVAQRRFSLLNKETQLVMQWPDLPFEIGQDAKLVQQCTDLLDRTLFFFTHQQLNAGDMVKKIGKIINQPGF